MVEIVCLIVNIAKSHQRQRRASRFAQSRKYVVCAMIALQSKCDIVRAVCHAGKRQLKVAVQFGEFSAFCRELDGAIDGSARFGDFVGARERFPFKPEAGSNFLILP